MIIKVFLSIFDSISRNQPNDWHCCLLFRHSNRELPSTRLRLLRERQCAERIVLLKDYASSFPTNSTGMLIKASLPEREAVEGSILCGQRKKPSRFRNGLLSVKFKKVLYVMLNSSVSISGGKYHHSLSPA